MSKLEMLAVALVDAEAEWRAYLEENGSFSGYPDEMKDEFAALVAAADRARKALDEETRRVRSELFATRAA